MDKSRLEAMLNVPEREVATLKAGLKVQFAVDALPGKKFTGTIDARAGRGFRSGTRFRVICAFAGGGACSAYPHRLRPARRCACRAARRAA